ncbi:MAG: hypothetical protein PBV86_23485 [Delftia lacustris]|uniref:hypothetical protein n=1 Tax=Delftia lacustris TaxID=558537 RepID=UPI002F3E75F3
MIDKHLDKPAEAMGLDDPTTLAFGLVMPLFVENEAISAYIEEMHQPHAAQQLAGTDNSQGVLGAGSGVPARPVTAGQLAAITRTARAATRNRSDSSDERSAERAVDPAALPARARGRALLANVRAALPQLLPGQQEDVAKTERALAAGPGMLLTNGTGTGKTFVAWAPCGASWTPARRMSWGCPTTRSVQTGCTSPRAGPEHPATARLDGGRAWRDADNIRQPGHERRPGWPGLGLVVADEAHT